MPTLVCASHAKLNLSLRVLRRRPDGYHDISSVFERISLCDTVRLCAVPGPSIRFRCASPSVPSGGGNLCVKAALALQRFAPGKGCSITLTKRIPVGSGMGGGSSNAAAVLTGLARLWRLKITEKELLETAAGIGSDVPFFVSGCRFGLVTGRGERIKPFTGRGPTLYHVILMPCVSVATKGIYDAWDRGNKTPPRRLTTPGTDATIILQALKNRDLRALCGGLRNDLESVTGSVYPGIRDAIKQLSQEPEVAGVSMTGSGAAVFGVFGSKRAQVSCARRLHRGDFRVFCAETA